MNILVYINTAGNLAKSALEAVTYASKIGGSVSVVATGTTDDATLATLGEYGAQKVMVDRSASADDAQQITRLVAKAAEAVSADVIVFSHDLVAKAVAPRLSVLLKEGYIPGAVVVPDVRTGFCGKLKFFSGKPSPRVPLITSKKSFRCC